MRVIKVEIEDAGEYDASGAAEEKPDVKLVKVEREEACEVENKQQELFNSVTEQASISCLKTDKSSSDQTAEDQPAFPHSGDVSLSSSSSLAPLSCHHCDQTFVRNGCLVKHLHTHTLEKRCDLCHQAFSSQKTLGHAKKHGCPQCEKVFAVPSKLKIHMRIHTGEKPFSCPRCQKSFSYKDKLKIHIRTHTGEKPFCCPQCGKSFSLRENLNVHMKIHSGEKPFVCPQCGVSFSQRGVLESHVRSHTGEKPFVCPQCGNGYARKENLRVHLRTHTGEKPYDCPQCGRSFTHRTNIKVHMRVHTGEKPFVCSRCGRSFAHRAGLHFHARLHARDDSNG